MRLSVRARASNPSGPGRRDRRVVDRRSPPSVVTAWLRQGLRGDICPLCRVTHKAYREPMCHFFDEGADQGESIDSVRGAFGFCDEHIEMLRRIEMDAIKSTRAISTMFADTFSGIVEDLESLSARSSFRRTPCPACEHRDGRVRVNARYLLDQLATSPGHREAFASSSGLCFAHFEHASQASEDRELILTVQRGAARKLLADMQEHVRTDDNNSRRESKGAERDSWRQAICMTAGWRAPSESAAEPERRR